MRSYLVTGDGQSLQLEEDQCEEANNEDDYRHLIVLNDAYDQHHDRKH